MIFEKGLAEGQHPVRAQSRIYILVSIVITLTDFTPQVSRWRMVSFRSQFHWLVQPSGLRLDPHVL